MFEIEFLNGARAGVVIAVSKNLRAGRLPDCDIEVPDAMAGRHHMDIKRVANTCEICDNKSANGLFVNETRISTHQLEVGDIIRIGGTRMRFQMNIASTLGGEDGNGAYGASATNFELHDDDVDADVSMSLSLSVAEAHRRSESEDGTSTLQGKLNAIIAITEQLGSIVKLADLYGSIIGSLFQLFPQCDRGFIFLGDDVSALNMVGARQRHRDRVEDLRVSRSLCGAALERKSIVVYQDGGDTDFDQGMSLLKLHIRSAMVAPLMVKDEVLGLILIDTSDRSHDFATKDMELLATVSSHMAFSIKNVLLFEQQENDANMRRNFMRFLPKPVVEQMLEGEIDIELGGNQYHGTIFFSDIVGFTSMSEEMAPGEVIATMNDYFAQMVPCVERTGGAIDKFVGDAIMAFWGIPFNDGTSSYNAVMTALTMQTILAAFNNTRGDHRTPHISMAIGLCTGAVVAGNVGTAARVEYTVLGDTVNTASRIEERASADQVLVDIDTWQELSNKSYGVAMPALSVKNKKVELDTLSVRALELEEGDIMMHVPVRLNGIRMYIVRALTNKQFTLLHPSDSDINEIEVFTDIVEMSSTSLGKCRVHVRLPAVAVDNGLRRSLITVGDESIAGILPTDDHVVSCSLDWSKMNRSQSIV